MKIVQIAATESWGDQECYGALYALGDDGSIWLMVNPWETVVKWRRLPLPDEGLPTAEDVHGIMRE